MVDQFGFRPQSEKIIIFASPQQGQNSGTKYTPPAKATVRRDPGVPGAPGGATVLTVDLKPWGGGKTDRTSGDKVWYADISALQTPGNYYVYDAKNRVRSYGFRIADDVYLPVLKAAVRAYFYQRCGGDVPQANGGTWHHPACHLAERARSGRGALYRRPDPGAAPRRPWRLARRRRLQQVRALHARRAGPPADGLRA